MQTPNRFMVVDDDSLNNMLCELGIRRFSKDADIKTFTKPELALEFINQSYSATESAIPTILLLDINMPVLTGWEFLEIFKEFSDGIKQQFIIYILSSSIDERDKYRAEANPHVKGFLSKPLTAEILNSIYSIDNTSTD